ncbi:MAG: hypothetical protein JW728_03360 [Candidatus Aureabacteria bacterium]|nr:hypothetical protein [Candidatus Auribacterota bacterium]
MQDKEKNEYNIRMELLRKSIENELFTAITMDKLSSLTGNESLSKLLKYLSSQGEIHHDRLQELLKIVKSSGELSLFQKIRISVFPSATASSRAKYLTVIEQIRKRIRANEDPLKICEDIITLMTNLIHEINDLKKHSFNDNELDIIDWLIEEKKRLITEIEKTGFKKDFKIGLFSKT